MTKQYYAVAFLFLAPITSACALVEQGRLIGAEGAGRALVVECALSNAERAKNLAAVNAWLMAEGYAHRTLALDCDGDGAPDF